MEKFSEDIERLAGEQRELTKASSRARAGGGQGGRSCREAAREDRRP